MSAVTAICEATQRHGNALVLLILLKTWDRDELPTREDLAKLSHISPRQVERDLLKLVEDGEVEKVGRRGQVTRFYIKGLSHVSDESDNHRTDTSVAQPSEVTDPAPALSDVSVESATSDIPLSVSSDTCDRPFNEAGNGTKLAPYSDLRTSTDKKETSLSSRANSEPQPGEREPRSKFPRADREAYAAARGCGDGWLYTSRDGRYDDLIERWQSSQSTGTATSTPASERSELNPVELQEQINVVAEMLDSGRTLTDIHAQFGGAIRPAQWRQIASAAQAQTKTKPKPAESPPAPSGNVVPMARAYKFPAAG